MPEQEKKRWFMIKRAVVPNYPDKYYKKADGTIFAKYIWDCKCNTENGFDPNATEWVDYITGAKLSIPSGFTWTENGLVTEGKNSINIPSDLLAQHGIIYIVTTEGTGGIYYRNYSGNSSYKCKVTINSSYATADCISKTGLKLTANRNNINSYIFSSRYSHGLLYGFNNSGTLVTQDGTSYASSNINGGNQGRLFYNGSSYYKGTIQSIRIYSGENSNAFKYDHAVDRERFNLY